MKLRSYFWVPGAFALLVLLVSCPIDYPIGPRVETPSIQSNPTRPFDAPVFHNAPITITLSTTPADASIFFTTDGSEPGPASQLYSAPFQLQFGTGTSSPPPFRGLVTLRAIGIRDSHPDSIIASQQFQIFPREAVVGASGEPFSGSTTGRGRGYNDSEILVSLRFEDGYVDHIVISDIGGLQTLSFWNLARDHAMEFIDVMNCWDFVPITGPTPSSQGIRNAARNAFESITQPAP